MARKTRQVEDRVHKELDVVKGMLARALADYDNLNKRVDRERADLGKIASIGIIVRLLPVLDNLESAQMHLQDPGLAISVGEFKKVLIFSEMKHSVEKLSNELVKRGFKSGSIHGDKRQNDRQRTLTKFRNNELNILVATDVAARGLDIPEVTHVINYEIPQTYDTYIHRIGRTGRASKKGVALTFVG